MSALIKLEEFEAGAKKVLSDINLDDAYSSLVEYLESHEEELDDSSSEELFDETEDCQIWLDRAYLHVPELGVKIHEYVSYYGHENEATGEVEFEPDYSGWLFFNDKTNEVVYDEGYSSFSAAIHNGFGRDSKELLCDIYV